MLGIILIIIASLLVPGVIIRTKSIASGRKGPGLFQPLKDLRVLLRKGSVFSNTTGLIFRIAPSLSLASIVCALTLVPFGNQGALITFGADFVFFAYILSFGKFFTIIGALDCGSSFEGMGANREALYSMMVEPAFFILLGTFAMFTGYTSFTDIFYGFHLSDNNYILIFSVISFYLLIQIVMIENSRMPIDDPKTHLELTMIHEVMILDYSGFDKALLHIGTFLKYGIYGALITAILINTKWSIYIQIFAFFAVVVCLGVIIGLNESFRARNKMGKNQQFVLTLSGIALVAFVIVLLLMGKF